MTPETTKPAVASPITPLTLTFPVAAGVCAVLLGLVDVFSPDATARPFWALAISIVVGALVLAVTWKDTKGARWQKLAIGALNILILAATVLGVGAIATGDPVAQDLAP